MFVESLHNEQAKLRDTDKAFWVLHELHLEGQLEHLQFIVKSFRVHLRLNLNESECFPRAHLAFNSVYLPLLQLHNAAFF